MVIHTKLWKHQQDTHDRAVSVLREHGFYYILAGCGTGKTLTSLAIMDTLAANKVLIVSTKASLTTTWKKQIEAMTDYRCCVLDKSAAKNAELLQNNDIDIFIVNYEMLWRIKNIPHFDMIITDESHRIANHTTKQSRFILKLSKKIPYRLAMTGTGFSDRVTQLYGQFRFLKPDILGKYNDFFEKYTHYYTKDNIKIYKSPKNYTELMRKIQPYTTILMSEDVLTLPDVVIVEKPLAMPALVRKHYQDMLAEYMVFLESGVIVADNILVHLLRLQQLANGFIEDNILSDYKAKHVIDIILELNNHPVVIFTNFKTDIALIAKLLDKNKITYSKLTGDTKEHDRWIDGTGGQVLLVNYKAGSESVDLTRARYAIDYNATYSNTIYEQSRYRLRRPGADINHPITYFRLYASDTIDEKMWLLLDNKDTTKNKLLQVLQSHK